MLNRVYNTLTPVLLACVVSMWLSFRAVAACGPIPSIYGAAGGDKLDVKRGVTMNGNGVSKGKIEPDGTLLPDGTTGTNSLSLPDLDPASFPSNPSRTKIDQATVAIDALTDDYYKEIKIKDDGTGTLTGGGPFHIGKLEVKKRATLNLAAGTYYLDEFKVGDDSIINVISGPVKIYINDKFDIKKRVTINNGGSVADFQVFLYSDAEFKADEELNFTGLILGPSAKKIEIKKDSTVKGPMLTGGEVKIEEDTTLIYTAADQSAVGAITTCTIGVGHFRITHDGYGINCLGESVAVTPKDGADADLTGYADTIVLDTQSGKGSWTATTGDGTLTDATPNDGLATYAFSGNEALPVGFTLDYREGAETIDIDVYQSGASAIRDDDAEGNIAFSPSGFTVTAGALANPPPIPINDPIPAQIAGTGFVLHLAAFGQTPADPVCGIIEAYAGVKPLKFWSTYNDPVGGTVQATIDGGAIATAEGGSAAQNVTFAAGQAQVTAKYKDVGQIVIGMKDDSVSDPNLPNGIRGAGNAFVLKPANFTLSNIRLADGAGPDFCDSGQLISPTSDTTENATPTARAGEAFCVTVTVSDAEGATTPNYGRESSPETVLLAPAIVASGGASNPAIGFTTGFGFTSGVGVGSDFSWGEVGIITLTPSVGDGDYLGAGNVTGTISGNAGRFTPYDFGVAYNSPEFTTACGTFTYGGQSFGYGNAPVITVTARNESGATTRNYTGAWWKITDAKLTGAGNKTYAAATGTLDLGAIPSPDPTIADGGNGTGSLTFSDGGGIAFTRSAPVTPFDAEISLSIDVIDADDLVYPGNPAKFGDASAGNGIAFDSSKSMRYGRVRLSNAFGSELIGLAMPLAIEYWADEDGDTVYAFTTHAADTCTGFVPTDFTLSNYHGNLQPGETSVTGITLANGTGNLTLGAPGVTNDGSVDVTGAVPLHLEYDWDTGLPGDEDPTGRATFGIYRGEKEHIYLREVY